MSPAPEEPRDRKPGKTIHVPRNLRVPFVRRCTIIRSQVEQDGMVLDLSVNGAYVMSDLLPSEGESLVVAFGVPRIDRLLRMRGVVAWINPHQAHPVHSLPSGFGFCFLQPQPQDMKLIIGAIQDYCRSNPLYRQYL